MTSVSPAAAMVGAPTAPGDHVFAVEDGAAQLLFSGDWTTVRVAGDGLVSARHDEIAATAASGQTYYERPATIRHRRADGEIMTLAQGIARGALDAAGPTHACITDVDVHRAIETSSAVHLVPIDGGPIRTVLRDERVRCLVVDERDAYVFVRGRGVLRLPLRI